MTSNSENRGGNPNKRCKCPSYIKRPRSNRIDFVKRPSVKRVVCETCGKLIAWIACLALILLIWSPGVNAHDERSAPPASSFNRYGCDNTFWEVYNAGMMPLYIQGHRRFIHIIPSMPGMSRIHQPYNRRIIRYNPQRYHRRIIQRKSKSYNRKTRRKRR